jgi:hypothetical protein
MWAGFLMFLLVAVFNHVARGSRSYGGGASGPTPGLARFIAEKKIVALGLATLLVGMALWNLGLFAAAIVHALVTGQGGIEWDTSFYTDLFTVMIFTDVLILILSLNVSGRYEMVFRNAAFVVSIILIRFALTEGYPFGAPLAVGWKRNGRYRQRQLAWVFHGGWGSD